MALLLIVLVLMVLLMCLNWPQKPVTLRCPVEHVDQDDSSVSYYDARGKIRVETDGCNDCIQSRAEQLQERDVTLVKVVLGRRNTGQL